MRAVAATALLLAVVLLVAACGGEESSGVGAESAAGLVPASAAVYASVDVDTGSDQWKQLDDLLERFPGRERLVGQVQELLADEGVSKEEIDRAFGPTVELVVLDSDEGDAVGLTKTDDRAALEGLLAKGDGEFVLAELEDGWTAFSEEQSSIDALAAGAGALADEERFTSALDELPDDALAKVYVNGEGLEGPLRSLGGAGFPQAGGKLEAMSAALVAEDDGLRLAVYTKSDGSAEAPDVGELLEDVPDDVIAFVDLGLGNAEEQVRGGMEGVPGAGGLLEGLEALGLPIEDVAALFREEVVLYVRPGALIPEVTLVAKADAERGRRTVERLLEVAAQASGGTTRTTEVDGLEVTEAAVGPISLFATAYDDRVVVTTIRRGIEDLRGDGDRLEDDERYRDAREAAGVEDGEDVYLYVDVDEAYGLAERLAQLAGEPLPADARENVEPLRAVLVSGEVDGDEARADVFVALD